MHTKHEKEKKQLVFKLTRVNVQTKSHAANITRSIGCINISQMDLTKHVTILRIGRLQQTRSASAR